jgi:hypothetical protein
MTPQPMVIFNTLFEIDPKATFKICAVREDIQFEESAGSLQRLASLFRGFGVFRD